MINVPPLKKESQDLIVIFPLDQGELFEGLKNESY